MAGAPRAARIHAGRRLTLALGIAVNMTMFSVISGVLLAELPYREPERLALIRVTKGVGILALLSSFVPALRAARVHPARVLRSE